MRALILAALAFALPAWGGDPVPKQDTKAEAVAKELKRLAGTWELASTVVNGNAQKMPEGTKTRLTIRGESFTGEEDGKVVARGTLKVNPAKNPRFLDLAFSEGERAGMSVPALYELTADELRLCVTIEGKQRPTELSSEPDSGRALQVYRRVKDKK